LTTWIQRICVQIEGAVTRTARQAEARGAPTLPQRPTGPHDIGRIPPDYSNVSATLNREDPDELDQPVRTWHRRGASLTPDVIRVRARRQAL
jgi:hypothetical protein